MKGGIFMSAHSKTQMSSLQLRRRTVPEQPAPESTIEWHEVHKRRAGESLLRNLAVSAALVLCAVTLRSGTLSDIKESTDVILTLQRINRSWMSNWVNCLL